MSEVFIIGNGQMTKITGQHGITPECPNALFKKGDVVKIRNRKHLAALPRELVVAVAIPPDFSPDHALSDLLGEPRDLMVQVGSRRISYILVRENDPKPYLIYERDLASSDKAPIEIGQVTRATS